MVFYCHGFLLPWFFTAMVFYCHGFLLPWFFTAMVYTATLPKLTKKKGRNTVRHDL
jgi:hypothetical protein